MKLILGLVATSLLAIGLFIAAVVVKQAVFTAVITSGVLAVAAVAGYIGLRK